MRECPKLSSGPGALDGSRILNQTALGVRYQGKFGGLGLLAYASIRVQRACQLYRADRHGILRNTAANLPATAAYDAGSTYNGKYGGLSFGSGGVALTFAGFTLGANAIGGRLNGQLALAPKGGAPEVAYTVGLKYVTGPLTVGVVGEIGWYQGNVRLTGVTQRRGRGITGGVAYTAAPGLPVFAEYLYQETHQGSFNFVDPGTIRARTTLSTAGFHDRQPDQLLRLIAVLTEQAAGLSPPLSLQRAVTRNVIPITSTRDCNPCEPMHNIGAASHPGSGVGLVPSPTVLSVDEMGWHRAAGDLRRSRRGQLGRGRVLCSRC